MAKRPAPPVVLRPGCPFCRGLALACRAVGAALWGAFCGFVWALGLATFSVLLHWLLWGLQ